MMKGNKDVKTTRHLKSTITHLKSRLLLAACLILAALGPPATELSRASQGRGSPPVPVSGSFIVQGGTFSNCAFDVEVSFSGLAGEIDLPGNRFIFTAPQLTATLTNLENGRSVTLSVTGAFHQSTDQNGNVSTVATGRNLLGDPIAGFVLAIGDFSFVFDSNGNLIQPLTGQGQLIDVCGLINWPLREQVEMK
jgi:hypothetical protein